MSQFTINTTDVFDRAVEEIRQVTGRETASEVIRDALELYDLIIQYIREGSDVFIGKYNSDDGMQQIVLPALNTAKGRRLTIVK